MQYLFKIIALFATCMFLNSCDKNDDPPPSIENHLPTAEAMQSVNLDPGSRTDSMVLSTGIDWDFRLTMPFVTGGQKFPLILALHWAGKENTFEEYSTCLAEKGFEGFPAIIFAPENYGLPWTEQYNRERLERFLELATEHWPVDTDRIAITGYSLGGTASWELGQSLDNYFSAAIPMGGTYQQGFTIDIPTYIIHGQNDELFDISAEENAIQQAIDRGSNITFVQADSLTHYEACAYAPYLQQAVEWLENEVW